MGFRSNDEAARQRMLALERALEQERERGQRLEEQLAAALSETPEEDVPPEPKPDALPQFDTPEEAAAYREKLIAQILSRPRLSWREVVDYDAEVAEAREVMRVWENAKVTSERELVGVVAAMLGRPPVMEPPPAVAPPPPEPPPPPPPPSRWKWTWGVVHELLNGETPSRSEYAAAAERVRTAVKIGILVVFATVLLLIAIDEC